MHQRPERVSEPVACGGRSSPPGPAELVLVRHAESLGNVADREAREHGRGRLDLDLRDADVELSETGLRQAEGLARHISSLDDAQRPTVVLSSPYRRAADTARRAINQSAPDLAVLLDERLRERDLGAFDRMTGIGIREAFPEEARRRQYVGKFYYRPPGGESWCDVALRVRSVLNDIRLEYDDARVWVFSHQAVIMSFRLVLEALDEQQLLDLDRQTPVANCSLTTFRRSDAGKLSLASYDESVVLGLAAAPVTHEPDRAGRPDALT
jgi:broad specificity phosphatase PhoE